MKSKTVHIVGSGLGGLSAACLLASRGYEVTVFEKNVRAGGKINEWRSDGYRFDTGPSLLTMPFILESLFEQCGEKMDQYLQVEAVDPICRYFFSDRQQFDCFQHDRANIRQIREFAPEDEQAYQDFLNYSEKLYERTKDAFLYNPLYHWRDFFQVNPFDFLKIDAFKTVANRVNTNFSSLYLRQFFKRFTTYNGSSPYRAPATLNVIPHVELSMGGYYIKGGMYRLVDALMLLARKKGAQFNFEQEIQAVITDNGKATGIRNKEGETFESDLIICNSDAAETYLNLLPKSALPDRKRNKIKSLEPSCSGFVLMLGVHKTYPKLAHHTIFFSDNYEREFRQIFQDKVMPDDPTIYVANTSITDSEHAPKGGSNLFILINAPYLSDQWDWKHKSEKYSKNVLSKLEKKGLKGLRDSIQVKKIITPRDFYRQYRSNKGSIYGTSSNSKLAAFARPRNKSSEIENLYLVGGSTHPGGGIPLVTLSAFHAVELLERK